ncbi:MAG: hypothetical protein JW954_05800 [Dehalococcoidaceae bacterium]|nr:hypothetical protein [Dehalococcoidaceae bacterium]
MKIKIILVLVTVLVSLAGCSGATAMLQPGGYTADEKTLESNIILSNLVVETVDQSGFCDIKNLEYGEDIIISVEAANTANMPAGRDITVYIDWKEYQTRHITLGAGENTVVVFDLMIDTRPDGIYQVAIDELWSFFGVG